MKLLYQRGNDLNADQNGGEDGTESDDDDEDTGMVEIRYVPVDKSVLDQIFEVMSDCQALHPDEEDDFSDEEEEGVDGDAAMMGDMMAMGDGQFFTSADDVVELNEEGQANLRRILQGSNGQGEGHHDGNGDENGDENDSMDQN
uniref:Methylosome subunit pICln n=1 Tax=Plectus sambesii TaxID=2011161 RepID=A0A914X8S3_9BILA